MTAIRPVAAFDRRTFARRRMVVVALASLAAAPLAGCGAGDPTYYTLNAWPGAPHGGGPGIVEVRSPTVASFLDRDYIVTGTNDYALELAGNRAWAEPLGQMIGRVLASDLAQRLPASSVYAEGTAAATTPDAVVSLDVGRFDKDASGTVTVSGSLSVRARTAEGGATAPGTLERFDLRSTEGAGGTAAMVATLSRLLGGVADTAANRLLALPAAGSAIPLAAAPAGTAG